MKKRLSQISVAALFAVLAMALPSCDVFGDLFGDGDDDGGGGGSLQTEYFSIEGAQFSAGEMPQPTTNQPFSNLVSNEQVLAGGSSIITVESAEQLSEFYVGVNRVDGYYTFPAEEVTSETRANGDYVYRFTILVSQVLGSEFTVRVSALTVTGQVIPEYSVEFGLLNAGTGALQVNLSFSNSEDVDLYLVLPDGEEIYYNNEGRWDSNGMIWGLDVDSNAGCGLDHINSENIFFPEEYVMNGTYTVYVNLYMNCSATSGSTSWTATAMYHGALIDVISGRNPGYGTFAEGAPSNGIRRVGSNSNGRAIKVMEFTISGAALNPGELDWSRATRSGAKTPKQKMVQQ